jgi:hypothetical protein
MSAQEDPGEIAPLGRTQEWGGLLLRLLELAGWTVTRRHLAGAVILTATGHGTSVSAAADTYQEAAFAVFERAMALRRWGAS